MAYASANFKLLAGGLSGTSVNMWLLDATDAIATVNTSNFVSDGYKKGARQGDIVWVRTWDTVGTGSVSAVNICWVIDEQTGTDEQGIDLTDGQVVAATDTD